MTDPCARCGEAAVHTHHRKLRSQGGDDSAANTVRLCLLCHDWVHHNPAEAYEQGWLVKSWDDPETVAYTTLAEGEQAASARIDRGRGSRVVTDDAEDHNLAPSASVVPPGTKCPECGRRVNHPKKESSPKSEVESLRMPAGDKETWQETLEATAGHVGVKTDEKYWKHKVILLALAYLLQADAKALKQELAGRGG